MLLFVPFPKIYLHLKLITRPFPHDMLKYWIYTKNCIGGKSMKSTGIVRKVDELGRIVIPRELRRTLGIEIKDPLEIFVEGEKIVFQKYKAFEECAITGEVSENNITVGNGKLVLSKEGAELIMKELESVFSNDSQK